MVLSVDVELKLGTRASPFVDGLGVSGRASRDWKPWQCTSHPREAGRMLTMSLRTPGENMAYFAERYSQPTAPGAQIVDHTGETAKAPLANGKPVIWQRANLTSLKKFIAKESSDYLKALTMSHLSITPMSDKDITAMDRSPMGGIKIDTDPTAKRVDSNGVAWYNRRLGEGARSYSSQYSSAATQQYSSGYSSTKMTEKFKPLPHKGPNTGAFSYQCGQEFARVNIKRFSEDAQKVMDLMKGDRNFYYPFNGKYRYECKPPKGLDWATVAGAVDDGRCLPCYRLEKSQVQIGSAPMPPVCRHKDEVQIRKIHPLWRTTHAPMLPHRYRKAIEMKAWGEQRDLDRHGTCNYIGCADPTTDPNEITPGNEELGETTKEVMHGIEVVHTSKREDFVKELGESAGGPGDTYAEPAWKCDARGHHQPGDVLLQPR